MTLAEQEPEKNAVSEAAPVPAVSEADRIATPAAAAPPPAAELPPTGDEPTVFIPSAPRRPASAVDPAPAAPVLPAMAEPRVAVPPAGAAVPPPPPVPAAPTPVQTSAASAISPPPHPVGLAAPQAPGLAPPHATSPTVPPVAPIVEAPKPQLAAAPVVAAVPVAAAPVGSVRPVASSEEATVMIAPALSNRPGMVESRAPAVMPAAPMAPQAGDVPPPMGQIPAAIRPIVPPPPPVMAPPPPPPGQPPRLPEGEVGPGGRKPLVARKRLREQPRPIASEIQPSDANAARRRRHARSRAARSSVVVVFDGLISLSAAIAAIFGVMAIASRQEFEEPGPAPAAITLEIPAKSKVDDIGDILEKAGVISNSTVFVWGARIAQLADLKAGEYAFKPHATMREVADELQQGKVIQHKITFPEGWTSEQVVQRLLDETRLAGKIASIPEEGSLLPDTYNFTKNQTKQSILDKMRHEQDRRLTEIWAHRNADALKMLRVPKDLVVLASIVEKETGKADERARVAAVFVNRLNRGMRLETDPTILYGLYGGKAWLEPRTLTKADLAAPNPYNTYKINGLPPGPIGNPGRAALEAVANPAATNDLFFVADGTGGHVFAETLEEHNRNVARWREIEKQRRAADPNAPASPGGTGLLNVATPPGPTPAATNPAKPTAQKPKLRVQPNAVPNPN